MNYLVTAQVGQDISDSLRSVNRFAMVDTGVTAANQLVLLMKEFNQGDVVKVAVECYLVGYTVTSWMVTTSARYPDYIMVCFYLSLDMTNGSQ